MTGRPRELRWAETKWKSPGGGDPASHVLRIQFLSIARAVEQGHRQAALFIQQPQLVGVGKGKGQAIQGGLQTFDELFGGLQHIPGVEQGVQRHLPQPFGSGPDTEGVELLSGEGDVRPQTLGSVTQDLDLPSETGTAQGACSRGGEDLQDTIEGIEAAQAEGVFGNLNHCTFGLRDKRV